MKEVHNSCGSILLRCYYFLFYVQTPNVIPTTITNFNILNWKYLKIYYNVFPFNYSKCCYFRNLYVKYRNLNYVGCVKVENLLI